MVLEPQYLLYEAGEGFFERFIPYDGFGQLLSPGAFGREFYADELQAAVFLVYYRDGEDV